MTSSVAAPPVVSSRHAAVIELARIETATMLRRASIVIGLAMSVLLVVTGAMGENEWTSQKYESIVPLSMFPMAMATFVAGVLAANRDGSLRRPPLAAEAPVGPDDRALARLASLMVPVGLVALAMLVVAIASRVEGGFSLGVGAASTDRAVHSVFELAQPPLFVAAVGAAAIAVGRTVRTSGPAIVLGLALLYGTGTVYWVLNDDVFHAVALMQVQPFEGDLAVHVPTAALHDVYLVGLVALCAGLALRGARRRRLTVAGGSLAVIAVVAQLVVSPR